MLSKLNTKEVLEFIKNYQKLSSSEIALKAQKFSNLPIKEIANQITCRQKAKVKLPSWSENYQLIFPEKISWEQCSSEQTATFKASLLKGSTLVDLTGGFGIDSYYFSKSFMEVVHIELQKDLQEIANYNFKVLNANNITSICGDSTKFLSNLIEKVDSIYLDPARRNEQQSKVHSLEDCTPNVLEILPKILEKTNSILLKTSPLLDIKKTISDLKFAQKVWVVSHKNDCKEVLYLLTNQLNSNPIISAVNLETDQAQFFFQYSEEEKEICEFDFPNKYLYEPNNSILKAGFFKSLAVKLSLKKLHPNTHLYTSDKLINHFPGRVFEILDTCKYALKELQKIHPIKKTNVACRNFPDSPEQLKKKLKLRDGGNLQIFGTTLMNDKLALIITKKVK